MKDKVTSTGSVTNLSVTGPHSVTELVEVTKTVEVTLSFKI